MINLLLLLALASTANAQWSLADYTAGKCVSVYSTGVDMSTASANSDTTGSALNVYGQIVYATSFDGASQSSGCVVAVYASTQNAPGVLRFTSTTTVLNIAGVMPGVLTQTCAPGAICKVGIAGIYEVFGAASTVMTTNKPAFSSTRCKIGAAAVGATTFGSALTGANLSTGEQWIRLP